MLVLVHRGIGFPLLWTILQKQGRAKTGNSSVKERIALMERFLAAFEQTEPKDLAFLCGDREFGGKDWIAWLLGHQIGFRLRIKSNTLIANSGGALVSAGSLFRDCPVGKERALEGGRLCLGQVLFVAGTRLADGDYLIVLSDREAPLSDYGKRWVTSV